MKQIESRTGRGCDTLRLHQKYSERCCNIFSLQRTRSGNDKSEYFWWGRNRIDWR